MTQQDITEELQAGRPTGPLVRGYEVIIGFETHAQLSTASKIFSRRLDRLRRRAQHPGLRGRPGVARHAAGDEQGRGRARHQLGLALGSTIAPRSDLRAQELLLSRPAQGLPDQPVRDSRWCRAARSSFFVGDEPQDGAPGARPPRGRRRQVAARGLRRPVGHRPEPRRHAAARDRHRARHALHRRGGRLCARRCTRSSPGSASATATCRKAASAATPTSRCAGPARTFGTRREIKNLNSFKFMQQAIDYEIQLADRPDRGRRQDPAGHGAVRPRHRRDPRDAQQGRRARLPLLPRPRPAAAGDRRRLDRARARRDARAAAGDGRALRARARPVGLRRGRS